jgi:hypothetical protein
MDISKKAFERINAKLPVSQSQLIEIDVNILCLLARLDRLSKKKLPEWCWEKYKPVYEFLCKENNIDHAKLIEAFDNDMSKKAYEAIEETMRLIKPLQFEHEDLKKAFDLLHDIWNEQRRRNAELEIQLKGQEKKKYRIEIPKDKLKRLMLKYSNNWTKIAKELKNCDADTAHTRAKDYGLTK